MGFIPQTLLIGNGFNLLHSEKFEWKNVLKSVSNSIDDKQNKTPYTHIYEKLYLDEIAKYDIDLKEKAPEKALKARIFEELEDLMSTVFKGRTYPKEYEQFFLNGFCPFQNVLTTNYDYGFDNALLAIGYKLNEVCNNEDIYSTLRKCSYIKNDSLVNVWHIHGEGEGKNRSSNSIMLGYDHYCGALSRIEKYVKNGKIDKTDCSVIKRPNKKCHYIHYLMMDSTNSWSIDNIKTWIDTFFFTDVHIIGFGMDFSEIDIWWLLNKRKRYLSNIHSNNNLGNGLINENKIFFYGEEKDGINDTLSTYGVICKTSKRPENKKNWSDMYKNNIKEIINYFNNPISIF